MKHYAKLLTWQDYLSFTLYCTSFRTILRRQDHEYGGFDCSCFASSSLGWSTITNTHAYDAANEEAYSKPNTSTDPHNCCQL